MKQNSNPRPEKGSPEYLQRQNKLARNNLLLAIIFTAINVVLLLANADRYFLFSVSLPYWLAVFGQVLEVPALMVVGIVVLALYLICYLLWNKHIAIPIATLVLFVLDSLFLVWLCIGNEPIDFILDGLFHIYVLYYLVLGVRMGLLLRKQKPKAPEAYSGPEF